MFSFEKTKYTHIEMIFYRKISNITNYCSIIEKAMHNSAHIRFITVYNYIIYCDECQDINVDFVHLVKIEQKKR